MHSDIEVFFYLTSTFGTLLRSPKSVNFGKELSTFPAYMLDDGSKLTKRSIEHVFSKHSLGTSSIV